MDQKHTRDAETCWMPARACDVRTYVNDEQSTAFLDTKNYTKS